MLHIIVSLLCRRQYGQKAVWFVQARDTGSRGRVWCTTNMVRVPAHLQPCVWRRQPDLRQRVSPKLSVSTFLTPCPPLLHLPPCVIRRHKDIIIIITIIIIIIIINPLTARVVGGPQMLFSSFLRFSLFSTAALWDLPNSRPVHSLMLSSHLFLCSPCLLPPFSVPCKMVLARPDERET